MSDFDDRELRDALRRRAGAATDGLGIEAAHSAVVARAGRVRRRRAAVAGGAAMAGLVAAAVFVIGPGSDSTVTTPADQTDPAPQTSVDRSVDTTAPVPEPEQTDPAPQTSVTTAPANVTPGPTTTAPSAIPPPPTASTTVTTSAPVAPGTTVPPTSPPTTTTTPTPTTTTTVAPGPEPVTQTYSSAGGSISVRWDGVALSNLQVTPAAGFTYEVEDERPDRMRVRFQGDGDFRIEIRVEDGQVVRVE